MKKVLLVYFAMLIGCLSAEAQTQKQLLDRIAKAKPDTNLIKLQLQLANYYLIYRKDVKVAQDSAIFFYKQALQLSDQLHVLFYHTRALKSMGHSYLAEKEVAKSMDCYRQAAKGYHELGNKYQEATCWLLIANALQETDEAEEACQQARLVIDNLAKNTPDLAHLYMDVGKYYSLKPGSEIADLDIATKYFNEANRLTAGSASDLRAKILTFSGSLYIKFGQTEKGRGYFNQAISYYQKIGDKFNEAFIWGTLGGLLRNETRKDYKKEAITCFAHCSMLYSQSNFPNSAIEMNMEIANILIGFNDMAKGRAKYLEVVNYYHSKNDKIGEAKVLGMFGRALELHNIFDESVQRFEQQRRLFHDVGKESDELEARKNIAVVHTKQGKLDQAEREFLALLPRLRALKYEKIFDIYDFLANLNKRRGNQLKELSYRLQSINEMEKSKIDILAQTPAYLFAIVNYYDLQLYDKCFRLARTLRSRRNGNEARLYYLDILYGTQALVLDGRVKNAYQFLTSGTKAFPEDSLLDTKNLPHVSSVKERADMQSRQSINEAYGLYYSAIGQNAKAEKHYLASLKDFEMRQAKGDTSVDNYNLSMVSKFYLKLKDFKKANFYLQKMTLTKFMPIDAKNVEFQLYQIDSAAGNYVSAIAHLKRFQKNTDSLFSFSRNKKVMDMEIAFETRHKQDAINALQNQSKVQELKYQQATTTRNWIISASVMLLLLLGVVYNRFRLKQRSNRLLENQQKEINSQNEALQELLADKDELLSEKDWLLKEVHHRVKNNLQIVMSLLSSQSAYLENSAAIEAIRESQNRVQAISLIHQKLYKSNNVASINMPAYTADLLEYLADSFDTRKRHIKFEQVIESFNLDLAQAVPIGLILNESVTNAIKYAFSENGGQIIVALQLIKDETLLLTIADNGRGFPDNFDMFNSSSLGMEMMKALSKQLGGEFKIENRAGVRISIEFQIEKVLSGLAEKIPTNS